ncbi:uncharacterized protein LOC144066923 [Stigmatopora argus]
MGCSTSSQTSAVDSTKPGAKSEETNGTIATVAANGNVAEDVETVSDQTSPADPSDATPADETPSATTAAPPPRQEEELQLTDAEPNAIPAGPPTDASPETTPPETTTQVEATDSTEPKQETEETIASSE